ncbi:hypothetical protein F8M41_011590 [Gigaspora margarita]|uniref:Uncharacterized protein n=1 Tax=Gigaspora margarita TaxID=4874 RepID=A0A8H3X0K3_GIGMA|nr:hypothetical protein F8M41_011590 [Gigaspora margarita]
MKVCIFIANEDEQLFRLTPTPSEFSIKKISFKDIKFRKSLKVVKNIQFNSNSNLDSTLASPLHVSNTDELASGFDNMLFELDVNSNIFEVNPTSNLLEDLETTIN